MPGNTAMKQPLAHSSGNTNTATRTDGNALKSSCSTCWTKEQTPMRSTMDSPPCNLRSGREARRWCPALSHSAPILTRKRKRAMHPYGRPFSTTITKSASSYCAPEPILMPGDPRGRPLCNTCEPKDSRKQDSCCISASTEASDSAKHHALRHLQTTAPG